MVDFKKIDTYIAEGTYWRAKEILQGYISSSKYDPVLFEKYGCVLMEMGDLLEAGKYLFVSGIRKDNYQQPISIYLQRYGTKNINHLFSTFPPAVQKTEYLSYPKAVIYDLEEAGYKPHKVKEIIVNKTNPRESITDKIIQFLILTVVLGLLGGVIIQGFRGIQWLWQWLYS